MQGERCIVVHARKKGHKRTTCPDWTHGAVGGENNTNQGAENVKWDDETNHANLKMNLNSNSETRNTHHKKLSIQKNMSNVQELLRLILLLILQLIVICLICIKMIRHFGFGMYEYGSIFWI